MTLPNCRESGTKLITHDVFKMKYIAPLALIFSTILHLGACQRVEIMPDEDEVRKSLGDGIRFTCTAAEDPKPNTLRWFNPRNIEITKGRQSSIPRVYTEQYNEEQLMLYITNIQTSDAGDYTCKGNAGGQPVSKKVTLTIYKDITFDDAPEEQHPVIYRDAIIKCRVSGNPTPTVAWRKNGQLLTTNDRYSMDEQGLHIKNISPADEGLYICRASVSSLGTLANRQITVKVDIPPKFTILPQPSSAIKGEDAQLRCQATGKPPPTYTWYKGLSVEPLVGDGYYVSEDGLLVVKSTSIDDGGEYKCVASNPAGTVDAKTRLTIIVKPSMAPIDRFPQTQIGNDITISCRGSGSPIPDLKWRRDGTEVDLVDGVQPNEGRIEVIKDDEDPGLIKLSIKDAQIKDAGSYICLAENSGGKAQSNHSLTVEFAPVFNYPEVPFNYSWVGHAANLTCVALGEPAPDIEWYETTGNPPFLNWRQINNIEGHYKIQGQYRRSNLEITALYESDLREYRCNATNKHGRATARLRLRQAYPPGPPIVTFLQVEPTWVEVTFTEPAETGLPIIGYIGEYKEFGSSWTSGRQHQETWEVGGNKFDDKYKLERLTPSKRYTFRFAAQNDVNYGEWSVERDETLPDVRVPERPEIVSSQESSLPNGYRLRWKIPADGGKHILNYGVRWRKVQYNFDRSKFIGSGPWYPEYAQSRKTEKDDQYNLYFKLSAEGERTMYQITKLESDSTYEIELYARNEIGPSEKNHIIFETGKMPAPGFEGKDSSSRPCLTTIHFLLSSFSLLYLFYP